MRQLVPPLLAATFLLPFTLQAQLAEDWAATYGGTTPGDLAEAVDVRFDQTGNVYTLGAHSGAVVLVKYLPNGDTAWTREIPGAGYPNKLEIDRSGQVVIQTGGAVLKYSDAGSETWKKFPPFTVYAMSLDSSDNVYIAGADAISVHARKYSAAGDSLWHRTHDLSGYQKSSAADAAGNFFTASNGFTNAGDFLTMKYLPNGDTAWARSYDSATHVEDPSDIEVGSDGSVVVAGTSNSDYAVVKYDSTGNLQWARHVDGPVAGIDQLRDAALDPEGNVYAAGSMAVVDGTTDAVLKLSPEGDSLWLTLGVDTVASSADAAGLIRDRDSPSIYALILAGALFQMAEVVRTGQALGLNLIDPVTGTIIHSILYGAGISGIEQVFGGFNSLAAPGLLTPVARNGGLASAAGFEFAMSLHRVQMFPFPPTSAIHTVTFSSLTTAVDDAPGVPMHHALRQNFPNPFNPSTSIRYSLPHGSAVSVKIFDVLGREVATLVEEYQTAGEREVRWDAAGLPGGVYVCRLMAGEFAGSVKLMLMK
jgi:hypothetical protein